MATIDYKEKYEQALERAKGAHNSAKSDKENGVTDKITEYTIQLTETIFPSLKESEDERIIKAIKSAVLQLTDIYLQEKYGLKQSDCIAWLEKQGETFTKKDVDDAYIKGICDAKHEFEKQGEQKPNFCHHEVDLSDCSEEYRKAYYDGWNNCNMQHSQCNSELEDVAKCLINGMKFYYEDDKEATWGTDKWSMPVKYIIKVLEKQCEQKPADKVEPKFKIGDVIRLKGSAAEYTIKRVTDTTYYTDGWSCSIERCEEDYELVEQKPEVDQYSLPVSDNSSLPTFDESIYHAYTDDSNRHCY